MGRGAPTEGEICNGDSNIEATCTAVSSATLIYEGSSRVRGRSRRLKERSGDASKKSNANHERLNCVQNSNF